MFFAARVIDAHFILVSVAEEFGGNYITISLDERQIVVIPSGRAKIAVDRNVADDMNGLAGALSRVELRGEPSQLLAGIVGIVQLPEVLTRAQIRVESDNAERFRGVDGIVTGIAKGRLIAGSDPISPLIESFVINPLR